MVLICLRNNIFFRARHIMKEIRMCWLIVYLVYRSTNSEQCRRAWTQYQPRCHHTFYQRTGWEIGKPSYYKLVWVQHL